jgi:serine/threonine-protein kinase
LYTRRLDQAQTVELAGTERAFAPFFSPDGQWVGFYADSKLKKISVNGGAAITLCAAEDYAHGAAWGDDGNIIASLEGAGPLSRIPAAGGAPVRITELDRARVEITHRSPQVLPGGKAVIFTAHTVPNIGFDDASIEAVSLPDRRRKTLQRGATFGRYLSSGHLVYVNRATLFAVGFDPDRLELRGEPVPLLQRVAYSTRSGTAQLDCSRTGTLMYRTGAADGGLVTVQWLDAAGKTQLAIAKPGGYGAPALSPEGQRLALLVTESASRELWVYDLRRNTNTKLTFDGTLKSSPVWTPDGRFIVFCTPAGIFWARADGSGKPEPLTTSKILQFPWSFTPGGNRLAFFERGLDMRPNDIWTLPIEYDGTGLHAGKPEPFLQTPFSEMAPAFSPDGRWLAYQSNESGNYEVYVRPFPGGAGRRQISNDGGRFPRWSHSGRELLYQADDRIMVSAYTANGDSFVAEKPSPWTGKSLPSNLTFGSTFDPAPDGKRLVVLVPSERPEDQPSRNHVVFLMNFFDELRRRTQAR